MSDLFWLSDAQMARLEPLEVVAGFRTSGSGGPKFEKDDPIPISHKPLADGHGCRLWIAIRAFSAVANRFKAVV